MPSSAEQINSMVAGFLAGQPLGAFCKKFLAFDAEFDPSALPAAQRDAYWAVYDLVCMTGAHDRGPADGINEATLRERLRHFHLREPGRAPA